MILARYTIYLHFTLGNRMFFIIVLRHNLLQDDFMTLGYMPSKLPPSVLTMAPRFDSKLNASLIARRVPLAEYNQVVD